MPRTYLDYDLLVVASSSGYTARVISSPAGQATAAFTLPFAADELAQFRQGIGRARHLHAASDIDGAPPPRDVQEFGTRLYDVVFTGPVGQALLRSLDAARRAGQGLRIRLRLGDVPELADLPWEYLYARELGRFLALSDETPLLRYIELAQDERPLAVVPPLRIVAVISDPSDVAKLDVEQEWVLLQEALRDLQGREQVALERLEQATLRALQDRLRQGDVHVLHFVGHGFFDAQHSQGGLVFEDDLGNSRRVSAEQLGTLLHDQPALRLVFLNACEGARGASSSPFAGVAQKLVQQRVPAVLAMQFAVSDAAAIALSHEFYRALADGLALDEATSEARKAVYVAGETFEWGTPVLFSRSPDGAILGTEADRGQPMEQPAGQSTGQQPETPWWDQIQAGGDVIIATIGAGASNVAVGKGITQQIYQLVGPPTPDDRKAIGEKLDGIEAALAAQLAGDDAAKAEMAKFQLQLLRGELTKTGENETPSAGAITLAGNWLLDNTPSLIEALTSLFATPAVGRVLGKAGEAAITWARERLGSR